MTDTRRHTYQPGEWFGVIGERATVILPPSEKARVPEIWALVDEGAGFDEALDALIANGLRDLPGFVLFSENAGATQVVVRGAARVELQAAEGSVEVAGSSVTTWVERVIEAVSSLTVIVEDAAEEGSLAIHHGLVRLSRLSVGTGAETDASPVAPAVADDSAADDVDVAEPVETDGEISDCGESDGEISDGGDGLAPAIAAGAVVAGGAAVLSATEEEADLDAAVDTAEDADEDATAEEAAEDADEVAGDTEAADSEDESDGDAESVEVSDEDSTDDLQEADSDASDVESEEPDGVEESEESSLDSASDSEDRVQPDAADAADAAEADAPDADAPEIDALETESDETDSGEADSGEESESGSPAEETDSETSEEADAADDLPWWRRPEEALTRGTDGVVDADAATPEADVEDASDESATPTHDELQERVAELTDEGDVPEPAEVDQETDSPAAEDEDTDVAPSGLPPQEDSRDDFWSRISGESVGAPSAPTEPTEGEVSDSPDQVEAVVSEADSVDDEVLAADEAEASAEDPEPVEEEAQPETAAGQSAGAQEDPDSAVEDKKPWWARAMGGLVGGGAAAGAGAAMGSARDAVQESSDSGRSALEDWAQRTGLSDGEETQTLAAAEQASSDSVPEPELADVPVFGAPNTPVARLSFSTGGTQGVAGSVVVGRAPTAGKVTDPNPTLVAVPSPNNEISSTHLEIRPGTGLDLGLAVATDLNSTNGTVVIHPGLGPRTLRAGVPEPLFPGSVVDLGDGLTIKIESPSQ